MSYIVLEKKESPRSWRSVRGGREMWAKSRIYVWEKGETIMENLVNRRNRPMKLYREILADQAFMQGVRWSRTAGCSCGCSPGFISPQTLLNDKGAPMDIHVTLCAEKDVYNAISDIAKMTFVDTSYLQLVEAA